MTYKMKDNLAIFFDHLYLSSFDDYTCFELIDWNKKNMVIKYFTRFLKENNIYRIFLKYYNDFERGEKYRLFLLSKRYISVKTEDLSEFLNIYPWQSFFINSFLWVERDFWCDVTCRWIKYMKEIIKNGEI